MEQALRVAAQTEGPFYLRLVRCEVERDGMPAGYQFRLGRGVTVSDTGDDIGLVSTGLMVRTAKLAALKLASDGIGVRLDHPSGGLYSLVAETLAAEGCPVPVLPIGTDPEDFIHTGHVNDLLHRYGMTSDHVVERALRVLHPVGRT
jgi:transketolase